MDINPYKFKTDFRSCEFANFHLKENTNIILCSMAWLKSETDSTDSSVRSTIRYWATRLLPLYSEAQGGRHTIFVACNRTGVERGVEFAGGSCVLDITSEHISVLKRIKHDSKVMTVQI
jgi:protein N-terminal amidase